MKQAQERLSEGVETAAVAEQLGLKRDTLAKTIRAGRLYKPTQKNDPDTPLSTKSQRSGEDAAAPMGMGACNVMDRLAASVGGIAAVVPACQAVSDVPNGGVLFALPAPLAVGLLHQTHRYFQCGLVHHTGLGNTVAQGSARDLDPKAVPWGQVRRPRKMGVAVSDGAAAAGSRKGPRPQAPWSER